MMHTHTRSTEYTQPQCWVHTASVLYAHNRSTTYTKLQCCVHCAVTCTLCSDVCSVQCCVYCSLLHCCVPLQCIMQCSVQGSDLPHHCTLLHSALGVSMAVTHHFTQFYNTRRCQRPSFLSIRDPGNGSCVWIYGAAVETLQISALCILYGLIKETTWSKNVNNYSSRYALCNWDGFFLNQMLNNLVIY